MKQSLEIASFSHARSLRSQNGLSQVTVAYHQAPRLAAHFAHLELSERPVRGLVEVGKCESVSLVWSEALYSSEHPLVMLGLLSFCDMLSCPGTVPCAPVLVLPDTDGRVGLKVSDGLDVA